MDAVTLSACYGRVEILAMRTRAVGLLLVFVLAGTALSSMAQAPVCPGDTDLNGDVTISEVQRSANSFLHGCPIEQPRFVDNGNGTISDNEMGLTWEKKSDDGSIHDQDDTYTWSTGSPFDFDGTVATSFLATLNGSGFAGHTDWRLPTREELQSIVDYANSTPPIVNAPFDTSCAPSCTVMSCSCTVSSHYWSSSTVAANPGYAWLVYFAHGDVSTGVKANNFYVRAVRTG
jgi:hypothetical protein